MVLSRFVEFPTKNGILKAHFSFLLQQEESDSSDSSDGSAPRREAVDVFGSTLIHNKKPVDVQFSHCQFIWNDLVLATFVLSRLIFDLRPHDLPYGQVSLGSWELLDMSGGEAGSMHGAQNLFDMI